MTRRPKTDEFAFEGFDKPESNFFRMPNSWTDITADITSLAELKVVEFILRHTWGYQEYGLKKHITIDEFVNGRRRQDGRRMDRGTGLSERAVYDGLRKAVADGLIEEEVDNSDRGRIKKSYSLRMRDAGPQEISPEGDLQDLQSGVQSLHPPLQHLHPPLQTLPPNPANFAPRSEKETLERQDESFEIRKVHSDVDNWHRGDEQPAIPRSGIKNQAILTSRQTGGNESNGRPQPGQATIGEILEQRRAAAAEPTRRRGRPPGTGDERDLATAYLQDWATVELGDEAPLSSSVTRVITILKTAGVPVERWPDLLYQARAITKEHSAQITKQPQQGKRGFAAKNRMPYFLAVLEDLVGLRDEAPRSRRVEHPR
jgi:hypothetical protein